MPQAIQNIITMLCAIGLAGITAFLVALMGKLLAHKKGKAAVLCIVLAAICAVSSYHAFTGSLKSITKPIGQQHEQAETPPVIPLE